MVDVFEGEEVSVSDFRNFLVREILESEHVKRALREIGKVRIEISEPIADFIVRALEEYGWQLESGTRFHLSPGGDLSLGVVEDGRTSSRVLRIELLSWIVAAHLNDWKDFNELCRANPLNALARAAFLAREEKNPAWMPDAEIMKSISNRSDAVWRLVSRERISLSGNPRDFSQEAWGFYSNPMVPKPIAVAKAGEQTFYVTGIFDGFRKKVLAYVRFQDKFHIRFFYFSQSGGNWHSGLWMGPYISKGEFYDRWGGKMSYERGTLVVPELQEQLGRLPMEGDFPELARNGGQEDSFTTEWQKNCTPICLAPIQNNCSEDLESDGVRIRNLLRDDRAFGEIFGHGVYGSDRGNSSFSEMEEYFSSVELPLGFLESLRYERKGDFGFHGELGCSVETHVCTSAIAGNEVLVVFARTDDRPHQWWVEDVRFVENSVSSWGFLRYQINAGLLASKPTEYHHQCPWFVDSVSNAAGIGKETKKGSGYLDIRPFIQSNPLIRKFADSVFPPEFDK